MKKISIILLIYWCIGVPSNLFGKTGASFCHAQPDSTLQNGDLIFQEDCGKMSEAIKSTTIADTTFNFTHVGLVWIDSLNHIYVIEAAMPAVRITPLQDFLHPADEKCPVKSVAARLKPEYRDLIPQAIANALQRTGKPYDEAFDLNNDKYYCAELIYDAFRCANRGVAVFPLNAMSFKDASGKFDAYWVKYFRKLHIPIPEGKPGINPNAMFRAGVTEEVHVFP